MTKITVKIGYTEETVTRTYTGHSGKEHTCDIRYVTCDMNSIEFEVESCDDNCWCDSENGGKYTTKVLNAITNAMDYASYDSESLENIRKIMDKTIYGKIYNIIESDDNAYYKVRNINELIKNFSENDDFSDDDSNDTVVDTYPFVVEFEKVDDKYIAIMHFNHSIDTNMLYVTHGTVDDSYCCYPGSYSETIPIQLSLIKPENDSNNFKYYNYAYKYRWNNLENTYIKSY